VGKLHELLAVEQEKRSKAVKIAGETRKVFTEKRNLFQGQRRHFEPFEDESDETSSLGYNFPDENVDIVTSVDKKLKYFYQHFSTMLAAVTQKEETNRTAEAELEIAGKKITLGATTLLSIEKALNAIMKEVLQSIPTTTTTQQWKKVGDIYESQEHETVKMKKIQKPLVLAPATKEHPAQVQLVTEDVPLGKWHTTFLSAEYTPEEKSDILERLDELRERVAKARVRANQAQIVDPKVTELIIKEISG